MAGCSSWSMTNSFVTNAVLIERAVSWHLHLLISQTTQYLDSWLSDLLQSELKMKLLLVEGARAPVPHSWRRHCCNGSTYLQINYSLTQNFLFCKLSKYLPFWYVHTVEFHGVPVQGLSTHQPHICHSVAEYCCPVWARSSCTSIADTQLHSSKSKRYIASRWWFCLYPKYDLGRSTLRNGGYDIAVLKTVPWKLAELWTIQHHIVRLRWNLTRLYTISNASELWQSTAGHIQHCGRRPKFQSLNCYNTPRIVRFCSNLSVITTAGTLKMFKIIYDLLTLTFNAITSKVKVTVSVTNG